MRARRLGWAEWRKKVAEKNRKVIRCFRYRQAQCWCPLSLLRLDLLFCLDSVCPSDAENLLSSEPRLIPLVIASLALLCPLLHLNVSCQCRCAAAAAAALLYPLHCLLSYLGFSSLFCCYVQSAESIDDGALSMLLLLEVLSNVLLQTFFDWWCCYSVC